MREVVDIRLYGDGRVVCHASDGVDQPDRREVRTDGVFDEATVHCHVSAACCRVAEILHDALLRLPSIDRQPGQFAVATTDRDGTTITEGQKQVVGIPTGLGDPDTLEAVLLQLIPERKVA